MKSLVLLFTIILVGCNNYLDKSVFEPLSQEELNEEIKKDSLFSYFYKRITTHNKYANDSIRSKYKEVTYRRAYKLYSYTDTALRNKSVNDWNKKYGNYHTLVDSISNYWKEMKEKQDLAQYVKIELVDIETKTYSFGGIRDVYLGFKLTPLKGKVDQMIFTFSIKKKIDDKYGRYKKMRMIEAEPFLKPRVGHWETDYKLRDALGYEKLKEVLRDHDILIEIEKIRFNGENISKIDIPYKIEDYWRRPELYEEDIIQEYIDKNYIDKYDYIYNQLATIKRKIDPLTAEYLGY